VTNEVARNQQEKIKILVIQGPTASGKSDLAVALAHCIGGEIVNADSMQVYRVMDIGTAKPSRELQNTVPHHLLDIVAPYQNFSAGDFRREAIKSIADIHSRGRIPIIVGGTGLYIRGLLHGLVETPPIDADYRSELQERFEKSGGEILLAELAAVDPDTAAVLHPKDHVRIIRALEVFRQTGVPVAQFRSNHRFTAQDYCSLKIGIRVERSILYERINSRVEKMIADGFIDEVNGLLAAGYDKEMKAMRSIGYREICRYLAGECSLEEAVLLMQRNTRRYAKRQETWLRGDNEISWVEYPESFASIKNNVIAFFD
jgi:tRNA dimethylallyltransferase